jgi:hypothetical protein
VYEYGRDGLALVRVRGPRRRVPEQRGMGNCRSAAQRTFLRDPSGIYGDVSASLRPRAPILAPKIHNQASQQLRNAFFRQPLGLICSLCFVWHRLDHGRGRKFRDRELNLLRLVFSLSKIGVCSYVAVCNLCRRVPMKKKHSDHGPFVFTNRPPAHPVPARRMHVLQRCAANNR